MFNTQTNNIGEPPNIDWYFEPLENQSFERMWIAFRMSSEDHALDNKKRIERWHNGKKKTRRGKK